MWRSQSIAILVVLVQLLLVGAVRADVRALVGPGETVYAVDANDRVLVNLNGDRPFIPASTLKVFTTLLATQYLGLNTRFTTEFFRDGDMLVVRGTGDPYLVSEELDHIAVALKTRLDGRPLRGVAVDDSFFPAHLTIPGAGDSENPYDAPISATGVNFNTINVARRDGKIVSAEDQTPLTPLAESLARRRNVRSETRISLENRNGETARYAAELIAAKLRVADVAVGGEVTEARAPKTPPLYVHQNSRTLEEVSRQLLYYSNNYAANDVFLAIGAKVEGPPASLDKSIAVARRFISAHPALSGITMQEGAGLSYDNRVTAPAMAALLKLFEPYKDLLRVEHGVSHKTGTLQATKTLVGYLETAAYGRVRFVIALDGAKRDRRFEIVEALQAELGGAPMTEHRAPNTDHAALTGP
jgi:serine-type D-Ala-D-Ala carboxypeptidase/endopeptidase (penicillin-binding protein 4)